MKKVLRVLLKVLLVIVSLGVVFVAFVAFFPQQTYDIPVEDFEASTDPEVLARGEYLVFGPAHCVECHSPPDTKLEDFNNRPPLSGGRDFSMEFAEIFVRNITPDVETGIGGMSNADIERTIRYSVNKHGYAMLPYMSFSDMSKEDMLAIVSYLRAQPAVKNEVPDASYKLLGKGMLRFLIRPRMPNGEIPEKISTGISIERGSYIVNAIGGCNGCHTPFSMAEMDWDKTKLLSGGNEMIHEQYIYRSPNLTPDEKTGHLLSWTEAKFVERFQTGRLIEGSPMPWEIFSEINEDDLRSIYRYLQTVEPVENDTYPTIRMISEENE